MDPRLHYPVGIAGQILGKERSFYPAQILPIHAVAVKGPSDGGDDRHTTVTKPAIHVLSACPTMFQRHTRHATGDPMSRVR